MRYLLPALSLVALAACDSAPSVPFVPPDRGVVVRMDQGPDLDQAVDPDDGVPPDQGPDPDDGVPPDQGDAQPDQGVVVSPRPEGPASVVVLPARGDTHVAWIADGALWTVRLDQSGQPGEPTRVTAAPEGWTGPLVGARAGVSPAWVVLPDGEGGALRAYDVTLDDPQPVDLDLWPPARTALPGRPMLVGRTGPGADSPVAWRTISAEAPPPPQPEDMGVDADVDAVDDPADPRTIDVRGMADPSALAAGLADTVLAFDSGLCAAILDGGALGNAWRCGARPGARLVGSTQQLVFVGQRGGELATWTGVPGMPDRAPLSLAQVTDGVQWLPAVGSAQLALVGEPDGRYLWWFEFDRVRRSAQPVGDDVLAATYALQLGGQAVLLAWSEDGALTTQPVDLQAVEGDVLPPNPNALRPPGAAACRNVILPEDCDGQDLDCDDAPRNGRCCQDRGASSTQVRLPTRVQGPVFTGAGDGYMLLLTAGDGQAELRRLTTGVDGADAAATVVWPDVVALQAMANDESRVVALAQTNAGAELLWYLGAAGLDNAVDPPRGPRTAVPCDAPLGLALQGVGQGLVARVFCPDQAYDYTAPDAEPEARAYAAGPLRWLTQLPPDGGPVAWLAATGDDHALARWRWAEDGFQAIDGLPVELEVLTDGPGVNREFPIYSPVDPGGWPTRVVDAQLQVLLPEGEWWRAPGTRWPVGAWVSSYEPLAVTVGHLTGLESRLTLFLHHLGADADFWGRPGVDEGELRWALDDHQGATVGAFAAGPFKFPLTWTLRGVDAAEALGEVVICE